MTRQNLKQIVGKISTWKELVDKERSGGIRAKRISKRKRKTTIRRSGGGRKRGHQDVVLQLKDWIESERSAGHTLTKQDLLDEWISLLRQKAQNILAPCFDQKIKLTEGQKAIKEMRAKAIHEKISKVEGNKGWRKQQADQLISWTQAQWMKKEQSAQLSEHEEMIRSQITWQSIDHGVYLMGAASLERLQSEDIICDPKLVIKNRNQLSWLMSDQIPLWAKSMGSRMIFSENELQGSNKMSHHEFNKIRDELKAAMVPADQPTQIIQHPQDEGKVKKLISGSKTSRVGSETEKFRITYEARQKITGIIKGQPIQGSVERGPLIFPGAHGSLDNLDQDGK